MRYRLWGAALLLLFSALSAPVFALTPTVTPSVSPSATPGTPTATLTITRTPLPSTPTAPINITRTAVIAAGGTSYTIRTGDTLFRIALRYGLTSSALAAANGITNPNLIFAGQTLVIPAKTPGTGTPVATGTTVATTLVPTLSASATIGPITPTATPNAPAGTTSYTVVSGDTLYRVAVKFKTTVGELQRLNNLSNINLIITGQKLLVPSTPGSTTPATATQAPAVPRTPTQVGSTTSSAPRSVQADFGTGIEVFLEGSPDVKALASQVSQLGMDWVKIRVNWRTVEATEGTLELAAVDEAVNTFNAAGIKVMLTLTGAPDWARPSATDYVKSLSQYGPPDDMADFGTFAGQIAARYAGKVQAYEIWSEPNLRRSWIAPTVASREATRMSDARYIDLLSAAYKAIKAADAAVFVVTGGLAPTGFNDRVNAIDDQVFLAALVEQNVSTVADGIGVQPDGFANPPDALCCNQTPGVDTHFDDKRFYFLETIRAYDAILAAKNNSLPLWVTRFGWGTKEGNTLEAPNRSEVPFFGYTSAAEQANYVPRAFAIGEELGYVGPMFLYNLNGCQVGSAEACYYSVINTAGEARPLFAALQGQGGLVPADALTPSVQAEITPTLDVTSEALPLEETTPAATTEVNS